MISLILPTDDERIFFLTKNVVLGPMGVDLRLKGQLTEFDSSMKALQGSRGIYGENHVEHKQISGSLLYYPFIYAIAPSPTVQYPNRVILTVENKYSPGKSTTVEAVHGVVYDKAVSTEITSSQRKHRAYTYDPFTGLCTFWEIWVFINNPTLITNMWQYSYKGSSAINWSLYSSAYWECTTVDTGTGGIFSGIDWSKTQSFDTIKSAYDFHSAGRRKTVSTPNEIGWHHRIFKTNEMISNPRTTRERIDALVASMQLENFPIEEKNYGDLAMTASQKVNANKVNMIAFLRDLRHPTEMIPKLDNLKSLKRLSDNYLTVKYGILPTIDDLETIIAAFKRKGPYIDKNGFDTYSAGYIKSEKVDNINFTLEQHIKLAIDDEDSEFEALIQRLDSMGTLPTFQNLWDLVPYSFVIDWFIDVGDFLKRVDTRLRLTRMNIRYATMSRKRTTSGYNSFPSKQFPFVGTIDYVYYHRWVSDQCPVPPLPLTSPIADFDHWLESGALIMQRTKR